MDIFFVGNKSLYYILLHNILDVEDMDKNLRDAEIRWQVIKAMLEEFPTLKGKVRNYLKEQESNQ